MLMLRTNANLEFCGNERVAFSGSWVSCGTEGGMFCFLDTIIVVLRGGINKIACFLVRLKIFNTIYSFFSLTLL